jgi:hypothetical protein
MNKKNNDLKLWEFYYSIQISETKILIFKLFDFLNYENSSLMISFLKG